ncbi:MULTISPECIES: hypothetical protein [Nitrosomonas]|uniref:hypothetical protein n=1 Tax=Nitrosomonas TaxID=914 RepID=UPI0007926AB4|nr:MULTISPECIES: hypothetical protein [Nitrosomonas]KXK48019.1 MAG: hypothetical protein UZ02_AOB001000587 [Nitrosomonas europaea]SEJ36378.1 hypothetical protein SAMN05216318_1641 [Nitrosomonas eutropha]
MRELVNPETLTVLELLKAALPRRTQEHFIAREWRDRERPLLAELAILRAQLLNRPGF